MSTDNSANVHCPFSVSLPYNAGYGRHIYNQFVIRTTQRNPLMAYLKEHKIGCEIYYPVPMHLQTCFTNLGYGLGGFPVSEQAAAQSLAIPIYPELTEAQQRVVVNAIVAFGNTIHTNDEH